VALTEEVTVFNGPIDVHRDFVIQHSLDLFGRKDILFARVIPYMRAGTHGRITISGVGAFSGEALNRFLGSAWGVFRQDANAAADANRWRVSSNSIEKFDDNGMRGIGIWGKGSDLRIPSVLVRSVLVRLVSFPDIIDYDVGPRIGLEGFAGKFVRLNHLSKLASVNDCDDDTNEYSAEYSANLNYVRGFAPPLFHAVREGKCGL